MPKMFSCLMNIFCYFVRKGVSILIKIIEFSKLRKVLTVIMSVLLSLAIIGICYNALMPIVMKYPHDIVLLFSSDVLENETKELLNNTKIIKSKQFEAEQENNNIEKNGNYIKKEYSESATYTYNVINSYSGILTPIFSLLTVIVAFVTLHRQRKQNELAEFENHLFQMIDQQHKLEEKVIAKHGSFRELYNQFCYIYKKSKNELEACRFEKEDCLKIAYYIFYFGIDKDFVCDNTGKWMKDKINNDEQYMLVLKKLNSISSPLFHRQKSEELGIYYRNLFNAIRYIDWECPDENKKNEYARLVRTNISDFAQLMLYYNMQGERGSAWLDKTELEIKNPQGGNDCLLSRYKPIKNCAINVENSDIDPREDNRKEFFSQEVIEYELKIATKDKC